MATRRIESFLLRIVVENGPPQPVQDWRGRIQHIASGAELQIAELEEIVAFINTHLANMAAPSFPELSADQPSIAE